MRTALRVAASLLVAMVVVAPDLSAEAHQPTSVDIQVVGDDGLTQRFFDAIGQVIRSSSDFQIASEAGGGDVQLEIPSHLFWCERYGRTTFQRVVVVTTPEGKYLGTSIGVCGEDSLHDCAAEVLQDVRSFLERQPSDQVVTTRTGAYP